MGNKKNIAIMITGIIALVGVICFIIVSSISRKPKETTIAAESGNILPGSEIELDGEVDAGETTYKQNQNLRTEFLDLYMIGKIIPPEYLSSVPFMIQDWLDAAFSNNGLKYTVTLDQNSIEQNEIYGAFKFHVEEFPQYSFKYAHYYGTNQVIIGSPELGHVKFD